MLIGEEEEELPNRKDGAVQTDNRGGKEKNRVPHAKQTGRKNTGKQEEWE